jgi:hypothetical protein
MSRIRQSLKFIQIDFHFSFLPCVFYSLPQPGVPPETSCGADVCDLAGKGRLLCAARY